MIERGTVVARRGDTVDVVVAASASCAGCGRCSAASSDEMLLRDVLDPLGAALGDEVEVVIPSRLRVQAALAIYVVPIVALVVGYLAGNLLGRRLGVDPDRTGGLTGVVLANVAFALAYLRERALVRRERFACRVRAIIPARSGQPRDVPPEDRYTDGGWT